MPDARPQEDECGALFAANRLGSEWIIHSERVADVLPQNPAPASLWKVNSIDEQREHWTHRVANLVLLNRSKNAQASNFDFTKKKTAYFAGKNGVATFALTSQVLPQPRWTPEVLRERQTTLLNVLKQAWLTD